MCKVAKVDESLFHREKPTERAVGNRPLESLGAFGRYMFGDYLWECSINDRYTDEEKKDLYNMLTTSQVVNSVFHLRYYYYSGHIHRRDLSDIAYDLLCKPLDRMPLYVNDEDYEARIVAVWRLKWAK